MSRKTTSCGGPISALQTSLYVAAPRFARPPGRSRLHASECMARRGLCRPSLLEIRCLLSSRVSYPTEPDNCRDRKASLGVKPSRNRRKLRGQGTSSQSGGRRHPGGRNHRRWGSLPTTIVRLSSWCSCAIFPVECAHQEWRIGRLSPICFPK